MSIEKEPSDAENFVRHRQFCTRARDGFTHLLRQTWPGGKSRILLPAYIGHSPLEGSGIFDPLIALGIPYGFYAIDHALHFDLASLERELARQDVFGVLAIHYFGSRQPELGEMKRLCERGGVILIEDCCHCIERPGQPIGDTGDYALYSIHKVLPCEDGGILQHARNAPDPGALPAELVCSDLPVRLWRDAAFHAIAERRVNNYRQMSTELQGLSGITPFWDRLQEGAVPLNFPVLVESADRFEVYKRMRAMGVGVVALYHTLVAAIEPDRFPVSHEISRKILNLPIHQDVGSEDVSRIVATLSNALKSS
ncbi:MAG TPA: DegT/DnrJ/EryC1/StrS family aminotransferase [Polyangiales bacterium]|nr:DegT/DnrJ/EryC1/StrS family aminotransferase [Polyangiales bacterium]